MTPSPLKTAQKMANLRLEIVQNKQLASAHTILGAGEEVLLSKEAVSYLIRALEYADDSFAAELEQVLVRSGHKAVPSLVQALASPNNRVRSSAAMALIQIGSPMVTEALKTFYAQHRQNERLNWIIAFVLQELGVLITLEASQAGDTRSLHALSFAS